MANEYQSKLVFVKTKLTTTRLITIAPCKVPKDRPWTNVAFCGGVIFESIEFANGNAKYGMPKQMYKSRIYHWIAVT
jgi:hypothetical protein